MMNGNAKQLKANYEEAYENAKDSNGQTFTIQQVRALMEMALADVYPDGKFSDDECNMWSLLRECNRRNK